jgi:hypothetical protein
MLVATIFSLGVFTIGALAMIDFRFNEAKIITKIEFMDFMGLN